MRERELKFYNASPSEYSEVITSGATGALHTVGEVFPWSKNSKFYYLAEVFLVFAHDHRITTPCWAFASTPSALAVASALSTRRICRTTRLAPSSARAI